MKVDLKLEQGWRDSVDALTALAAKGKRFDALMRVVAGDLEATTSLRFTDGVAPTGQPWLPLSEATRRARARRGAGRGRGRGAKIARALLGPRQPLLDTGRLRNSITSVYDSRSATIGTNVVYAPVHQFGSKRAGRGRRTRIPARPYLGLSAADKRQILSRVRSYLAGDL